MGLSSWSLDHIAFSWRVIPKAFRIKDPWESWNYQYTLCDWCIPGVGDRYLLWSGCGVRQGRVYQYPDRDVSRDCDDSGRTGGRVSRDEAVGGGDCRHLWARPPLLGSPVESPPTRTP